MIVHSSRYLKVGIALTGALCCGLVVAPTTHARAATNISEGPILIYSDPDGSGDVEISIAETQDQLQLADSEAQNQATDSSGEGTVGFIPLVALTSTAVASSPEVQTNCAFNIDHPHASTSGPYPDEIHTRITSICDPAILTTIGPAYLYRSRWYGWQKVSTLPAKTKSTNYWNRTHAYECASQTSYQYREYAQGEVTFSDGSTATAAGHETSPNNVVCTP